MLPKTLKNKVFSLRKATSMGVSRYDLKKLETQGNIEKISHGLYAAPKGDLLNEDRFQYAISRIGEPAIVCLLSALEYYNLTDIVAKEVWLMVPAIKRTRQKDIRVFRVTNLHSNIGTIKHKGFSITSIERTLVDSLTHQRQLPTTVGIEALRRAIELQKTDLSRVVDMAKKLGVFHRIRSYIEALA